MFKKMLALSYIGLLIVGFSKSVSAETSTVGISFYEQDSLVNKVVASENNVETIIKLPKSDMKVYATTEKEKTINIKNLSSERLEKTEVSKFKYVIDSENITLNSNSNQLNLDTDTYSVENKGIEYTFVLAP